MIELEAIRGIAAVIVVVGHTLLGFWPKLVGALLGTPLFALVNSGAAVTLFFVLSGFVLTYRSFRDNETASLITAALKRWPRLALPVLSVNAISGLILTAGLYRNHEAAALTHSYWLDTFFTGSPYPWADWIAAIYEGSFATFVLPSANYFNAVLWTMNFEFFGSFLSFAAAWLMLSFGVRGYAILGVAGAVLLFFLGPVYISFICGVLLARAYCSPLWLRWTGWINSRGSQRSLVVALWIAAVIILMGYSQIASVGLYRFLAPTAAFPVLTATLVHTAGSIMLIMLVLGMPKASRWLSGRAGALLGGLSFPIYLSHLPVICSIGAIVYLTAYQPMGGAAASALAIPMIFVVTFGVSLPLMKLDQWWLRTLRAAEKKFSFGKLGQPGPISEPIG